MIIHFQNLPYLQRLLKWLFSLTLESTDRYNRRGNEAHIYLSSNLWLLWSYLYVYRDVCISLSSQIGLNFNLLLQSADFSQPLIVIALIFAKWTNMDMIVFHWCSQVKRNKSKHQSRESLLAFTALHLGRLTNSKTIWKPTWDFFVFTTANSGAIILLKKKKGWICMERL